MNRLNSRRRPWTRGAHIRAFTLVEIILVISIIMILFGVIGPRLVGKTKQAKVNATVMQMENLKQALQLFEINAARFPTSNEGLKALVEKPSGLTDAEWPDRYVDELPVDPFGTPFEYHFPSQHGNDYDLISAGPDKQMGTEDDITLFDEDR